MGISGFDEIMSCGLAHSDDSDEMQKQVLMGELKRHNYVPGSMEPQYLAAMWSEFRQLRAKKRGEIEEQSFAIKRGKMPASDQMPAKTAFSQDLS